jgi:hypothetical protein
MSSEKQWVKMKPYIMDVSKLPKQNHSAHHPVSSAIRKRFGGAQNFAKIKFAFQHL